VVVEDLAQSYAGQPVLFLETDVDSDVLTGRQGRWWAAFGGGSVTLPMVMVDSGYAYSNGYENFQIVYTSMVNTSLARPTLAQLTASVQRVGDALSVNVTVTNQSGVTLGSSNGATVWIIVYETFADAPGATERLTTRYVRALASHGITPNLANGVSASYYLDVAALSGVVWDNLHVVALVDYRPGGLSGAFDTMQAIQVDIP
jgi:hypothetical protein